MTTRDRVVLAIHDLRTRFGFSPLQKEIADEVGICRGNLTRALQRLATEGRIARRRSDIHLTEAGTRSVAELRS